MYTLCNFPFACELYYCRGCRIAANVDATFRGYGGSMTIKTRRFRVEWPTLAMLTACYGVWFIGVLSADFASALAYPAIVLSLTLFSSLQHEVLHGHPTGNRTLNHALVFFPIGLFLPYERFRALCIWPITTTTT